MLEAHIQILLSPCSGYITWNFENKIKQSNFFLCLIDLPSRPIFNNIIYLYYISYFLRGDDSLLPDIYREILKR